jgi:hypothetical protein
MRIVTGLGPHENLIRPPARTAATTAAEVQLRGVPLPMTRLGVAAGAAAGVAAKPATTPSAAGHAIAATRRAVIAGMLRARVGSMIVEPLVRVVRWLSNTVGASWCSP